MGLANLVPGISGGTMLLAAGVYPDFVEAVAGATRLARRLRPWLVLAAVAGPAVIAIALLAGTVRDVVLLHRWIAYSIFIGLTLGGAPTLVRLLRPCSRAAIVSTVMALVGMVALALVQEQRAEVVADPQVAGGLTGLFLAGFAGAAAMVLPGVSGGYLLLVLGQYVAVLDAISTMSDAVGSRSWEAVLAATPSLLAIGSGVLCGVVLVSNLVRWLLRRHRDATLGALLGLLLGAVAGLWPFREPVAPEIGSVVRGVRIESVAEAEAVPLKHWPTRSFAPSAADLLVAVVLIGAGAGLSLLVARLGGSGDDAREGDDTVGFSDDRGSRKARQTAESVRSE
jgi:putative membrane protein